MFVSKTSHPATGSGQMPSSGFIDLTSDTDTHDGNDHYLYMDTQSNATTSSRDNVLSNLNITTGYMQDYDSTQQNLQQTFVDYTNSGHGRQQNNFQKQMGE